MDSLKSSLRAAKSKFQNLKRRFDLNAEIDRDEKLNSIITSNPRAAFASIRSYKKEQTTINKLNVGNEVFIGKQVADGFHQSISALKKADKDHLQSKTFSEFLSDHDHIIEICKAGKKIPEINPDQAYDLLLKMKPSVKDYFSITSLHYLNGGQRTINHFMIIVNAVLSDVQNYALYELNVVHAAILYKGHGKDKHHDKSYRTISTCPFIAKCIDSYVGDLCQEHWDSHKAETQFQGKGLSHEHSALLLTEAVHHAVHVQNKPAFCLYLDARSAFDRVVREILVRRLFSDGITDTSLLYIDQRLANRKTVIEWDKELLAPIDDEQGVEQGGIKSGELYKSYNNEQLTVAQHSSFGIDIGDIKVAAIGQADDVVLVSTNIYCLSFLLSLTMSYCTKYNVALSHEKTKLQVFSPSNLHTSVEYWTRAASIAIDDKFINFVDTAEHVGILRSVSGNQAHILKRISSHKRALAAVLSSGLARHHRASPAASLRTEKLHGLPVLMSGVAAMTFSNPEIEIFSHHYKQTLEGLLKVHKKTPESFIYFISGSLPFSATLHLRQLGLFAMICRLENNILHKIAKHVLTTSSDNSQSWFAQVKKICYQYHLPHPLKLLDVPPPKESFKRLTEQKVHEFWATKLRNDAAELDSLYCFKPQFMSLSTPHPIITSCGSNPYEINKAVIQLKLLSGRYRSDTLLSHFHPSNSRTCQLNCDQPDAIGDVHHFLINCSALASRRSLLFEYWDTIAFNYPVCSPIISSIKLGPEKLLLQFFLDSSCFPEIIRLAQTHGKDLYNPLFKMSRTFCYSMHRERLKILNRWRF